MTINKVLITGSAGYLGKNLYKHLESSSFDVLGLMHEHKVKDQQMIMGDLLEPKSFVDKIKNIDTVVHCAALVGGYWPKNKYRVNTDGTFNILNAAIDQDIKRFIHISSLAVVDEFIDHHNSNENEPYPKKFRNHYITSKILAEKVVLAKKDKIDVIILRPGWIWGPCEKNTFELIQMVKNNKFAFIGKGNNQTYFTHINNIIQTIELALRNINITSGEIFNITDGIKLTMVEFIDSIALEMNQSKITKHIPIWLANAIAFITERFKPGSSLTRQNVAIMSKNLYFSTAKAEKILGYRPDKNWKRNLEIVIGGT